MDIVQLTSLDEQCLVLELSLMEESEKEPLCLQSKTPQQANVSEFGSNKH